MQTLITNPLFEIRHHSLTTPVEIAIRDGIELNVCLASTTDNGGVPSLWTNNLQVLKVMTTYFEELWKKSTNLNHINRKREKQNLVKT